MAVYCHGAVNGCNAAWTACRTVEPQIREAVDMITGGDPTWEVTITGHSLGAALAVSCAYSLATSWYVYLARCPLACI